MAWLRIDDGFLEHPKIGDLSDRAKIVHLAAMLLSARNKTEGVITKDALQRIRASKNVIETLVEVGLWDDEDGVLSIHDWHDYNPRDPTAAERMRRYRERNAHRNKKRNADRNATVTESSRTPAGTRAKPVPVPALNASRGESASSFEGENPSSPRDATTNRKPLERSDEMETVGDLIPSVLAQLGERR